MDKISAGKVSVCKRSLHENNDWYAGLNEELALQHLYRSLDLLAEQKAHLETALFA
jgi:hypothetical protein